MVPIWHFFSRGFFQTASSQSGSPPGCAGTYPTPRTASKSRWRRKGKGGKGAQAPATTRPAVAPILWPACIPTPAEWGRIMSTSHANKKPRRIVIREELVAICGNYVPAVLLGQLIYWASRTRDAAEYIASETKRLVSAGAESAGGAAEAVMEDAAAGWIYKGAAELGAETMLGLSDRAIRQHLQNLVAQGWVSERQNPRYKWDRRLQYRVNLAVICRAVQDMGYPLDGLLVESDITWRNYSCEKNDESSRKKRRIEPKKLTNRTEQNDATISEITTEITTENTIEYINGHVASDMTKDHGQKSSSVEVRPAIPPMVAKLVESWNQAVAGTAIPRVRDITASRVKKAKVRLRERSLEEWGLVFRKIAESSFCKGGGRDAWVASFDWIISNDDNAAKVLEGYYDNRVPSRGAVVNRVNHVADATGGKSFEELEREAALRLESGEPYRWVGRM